MTTRALVRPERDLSLANHRPLLKAAACGEGLAVWIVEPEWLRSDEFSGAHLDVALQ
jgi:hypothetical protein